MNLIPRFCPSQVVCGNVTWVILKFLSKNSAKAIIASIRQMLHSVSVGEASGDVLLMANVSKTVTFVTEAEKVATVWSVQMRRNIFAAIFGSVLQVLQKYQVTCLFANV